MYFFFGRIKEFKQEGNHEDVWRGEKLMPLQEVISELEDSKEKRVYRKRQLQYLKQIKNRKYRNTAVAVIYNEKREILLCLSPRDDYDWKMPQGGIEEGETPRDAVIREVHEELRADIEENIREEMKKPIKYHFHDGFEVRLHPFLIAWNEQQKITLNPDEFSEYKWVNPDKIGDYKLGVREEAYRKIIEQFQLRE